jgi:hypothetical protein
MIGVERLLTPTSDRGAISKTFIIYSPLPARRFDVVGRSMWSEEFCGSSLWLEGWFQTTVLSSITAAAPEEKINCQCESDECESDDNALLMTTARKRRKLKEDTRDDNETPRVPEIEETPTEVHGSHCSMSCSTIIPTDAMERIENAKAKAILLLDAFRGTSKQTRKRSQRSRKKGRKMTMPIEFISTQLTPILETTESTLSFVSSQDHEDFHS